MKLSTTFSFLIPTLNEERHIANVVSQFRALDGICPYEVILGDGGSRDHTISIASSLGAKVVIDTREKKTVASGRNAAASKATGDIYVFCDADTVLSDVQALVQSAVRYFADRNVVAAIPRMEVFPREQNRRDKLFQFVFNNFLRTSFLLHVPFSRGQCQLIRAEAFAKVGGYNADQVHADDNSIFKKLAKIGQLRFITDFTVYESPRRYRKLGYLKLSAIGISSLIGQAILKRNVLNEWRRID